MNEHTWRGHTFEVRLVPWDRTRVDVVLTLDGIQLHTATWMSRSLPAMLREGRANPRGAYLKGGSVPFSLADGEQQVAGRLEFDMPLWVPRYPYRIVVGDTQVAAGELTPPEIQWTGLALGGLALALPLLGLIIYLVIRG